MDNNSQKPIEIDAKAIAQQSAALLTRIRQHVGTMPVALFTTNPLWREANWSGTTFRWHPSGEAPPIMGLMFKNAAAGKKLFSELVGQQTNLDRFEEVRVSIIEGSPPGQRFGYSVHIYPDPESLEAYATAAGVVIDPQILPFLGRWSRMYPVPGSPGSPMLPRFKEEFARHQEFLLAPATRRDDGQFYFDVKLGIVKNTIQFRNLEEITPDDADAGALALPQLITPT